MKSRAWKKNRRFFSFHFKTKPNLLRATTYQIRHIKVCWIEPESAAHLSQSASGPPDHSRSLSLDKFIHYSAHYNHREAAGPQQVFNHPRRDTGGNPPTQSVSAQTPTKPTPKKGVFCWFNGMNHTTCICGICLCESLSCLHMWANGKWVNNKLERKLEWKLMT